LLIPETTPFFCKHPPHHYFVNTLYIAGKTVTEKKNGSLLFGGELHNDQYDSVLTVKKIIDQISDNACFYT